MSQDKQKMYPRFRLWARIEHWILLISFTALAITGLPQRYFEFPFAVNMIEAMGGITTVRLLHRYAAVILILGSFYHVFLGAYRWFVKGERIRIMLRPKDAVDIYETVKHNLGLQEDPPKMTKFNFGEKVEYWAVIWGTAVMVITGFMLWNPIAITTIFPGQFIPAAKTAHSAEAFLAVASILIWHLYNVLIKYRNWSIFTGNLPHDQMEEEHAIELERLEAGGDPYPGLNLPAQGLRKRVYFFVAIGAAIAILIGMYWLFTFEETAITTLPAVTREVFVPLVTPTP
ncbi:MAG: cytochrome b/b6 domain-containing protein [Anaerolineales bacterium]|nr:cytochrome b/b6 domain-containing protein [Anaerolineales bacterium]